MLTKPMKQFADLTSFLKLLCLSQRGLVPDYEADQHTTNTPQGLLRASELVVTPPQSSPPPAMAS